MKLLAVCFVIFASTEFGLSHPADEAVADAQKEGVKLWALLVAGSNGYYNYRHQADICHAYQIMKKHGIPDERIVVMMYDDIANSVHNPMRGKIINEPNGNDVYHGVLKDYTEEHVNPKNFLNVLQGNKEAVKGKGSGKVINSGPNDHVFVNFADHGAPNILAFPSEELNKRDLHNAIINMHKEKKYGKMVFYVEACESGSMFSNSLPNNINVFATTAANGQESSYACYWDAKLETYLGDVYSIKWMEDSDKEDIEQETLQQQYNIVKSETNTSHVQVFGDPKVGSMKVGEFQGLKRVGKSSERSSDYLMDAVDSRDVQLFILANKIKGTKSQNEKEQLFVQMHDLLHKRIGFIKTVSDIFRTSKGGRNDINWEDRHHHSDNDCYYNVVKRFSQKCYQLPQNEYALAYLHKFSTLCGSGVAEETILRAIDTHCPIPSDGGYVV